MIRSNKVKLPADIILNLIDKYSESIASYYGKINKKLRANKPKYLKKEEKFNLYYFPSSYKLKDNTARLTIGKYTALNYNTYNGNKLYKITDRKYYNKHLISLNGNPFIHLNHYPIQSKQYFEQVKMRRGDVNSEISNNIRNWSYLHQQIRSVGLF